MGVTRKVLNWYARLSPGRGVTSPPYEHVVQIGDPTLRRVSQAVPVDKIKTNEVQTVIKKLEYVLHKYGGVGMSAPQIGVNMRIFVMGETMKQIASVPIDLIKIRGMTVIPYTICTDFDLKIMDTTPEVAMQAMVLLQSGLSQQNVFVNPKLKVVDYHKVIHSEACESIRGLAADVARYKEVEISGYNEEGEVITKVFKDWAARIAQHELDHLDGKLYTDAMDRKSLQCTCWEEVNLSKGRIVIPFSPE